MSQQFSQENDDLNMQSDRSPTAVLVIPNAHTLPSATHIFFPSDIDQLTDSDTPPVDPSYKNTTSQWATTVAEHSAEIVHPQQIIGDEGMIFRLPCILIYTFYFL